MTPELVQLAHQLARAADGLLTDLRLIHRNRHGHCNACRDDQGLHHAWPCPTLRLAATHSRACARRAARLEADMIDRQRQLEATEGND